LVFKIKSSFDFYVQNRMGVVYEGFSSQRTGNSLL